MGEVYGIAAFRSRQQVLRLEQALRREGIEASVISTPRDIAVGCGLSVKFREEDLDAVRRSIARVRPTNLVGIYRVDRQNGSKTRLTAMSIR